MSNSKKTQNSSNRMLLYTAFITILSLIFDQITKHFARKLKGKAAIVILPEILEIRYLENRGAAFGILQGQSIFFIVIAIVVFGVMAYIFSILPKEKKYYPLCFSLAFMLSGAIGNTLDRVIFGFVTDFIYFKLINFPTFNVADIWITCSTFFLVYLLLFRYKEEDLNFKSKKSKD